PEQCPDGKGPIGTDSEHFWLAFYAEMPALKGSFDKDSIPDAATIMDVIEYCYVHVALPTQFSYHQYFGHHHLSFDRVRGRAAFKDNVNRLFSRNGLAYELQENGQAIRLAPVVLRETIISAAFDTGDGELDKMLETARAKFLSPDPDMRRESLEKLWDAWERLKTIKPGADKKESAGLLLDSVADEPEFRGMLEIEAKALTEIGNKFQIRHSETSQVRLDLTSHVDYLFHRLFAFVNLVLDISKQQARE
ncbi:hypothetical protein LCGC14_3024570, partial [marine sediment metagenome]